MLFIYMITLLFTCESEVYHTYEVLWCLRNSTEDTLVITHQYLEDSVIISPDKSEPIFDRFIRGVDGDTDFLTFNHFHKIDSINVCTLDSRPLCTWKSSDYRVDIRSVYNGGFWQNDSSALIYGKIKHVNPFADFVLVYEYEVREEDLDESDMHPAYGI